MELGCSMQTGVCRICLEANLGLWNAASWRPAWSNHVREKNQKKAKGSFCLVLPQLCLQEQNKGERAGELQPERPRPQKGPAPPPIPFPAAGSVLGTDMEYNSIFCCTGLLAININVCPLFLLWANTAENRKHPVQHPYLTSLFKKRLEFLTFSFICEVNNFFYFNRIFQENVFFSLFPWQCLYIACITYYSTSQGILLLNTPITRIEQSHLA